MTAEFRRHVGAVLMRWSLPAAMLAAAAVLSAQAAAQQASPVPICAAAMSPDGQGWDSRPQNAHNVAFAKQVGLTPALCYSVLLCKAALSIDRSGWETKPEHQRFVQQATSHGLTVPACTALLDGQFRAAASAIASAPGSQAAPDGLVASIQKLLATLGYDAGPPDGVAGPQTAAAIAAFQRDSGMQVDGRPSEALRGRLATAATGDGGGRIAGANRKLVGNGTGFFITSTQVVTNAHVVKGCNLVRLLRRGQSIGAATILGRNEQDDVAVLRSETSSEHSLPLRIGLPLRAAEQVVVFGFPMIATLSSFGNTTIGHITALTGPRDDGRFIQISAQVHPGNSGGPVVDTAGRLVAIVVASLNASYVYRTTGGSLPQNLNFAIRASVLATFLDIQQVDYATAKGGETELTMPDVAQVAERASVNVLCYE